MTQDELKALIEDLRLNHEYCPKEVILQAADELEAMAQPEQEPVAWQFMTGSIFRKRRPDDFADLDSDGLPYWNPLYTAPPQRTERPVDCERCNRLEEQAYDLVGELRVANIKLSMRPKRKPLTDKAITQVINSMPKKIKGWMIDWDFYDFARAIEAAHDIKENT